MSSEINGLGVQLPDFQAADFYNRNLDFYQNNSASSCIRRAKRYIKEDEKASDIAKLAFDNMMLGVVGGVTYGAAAGFVIGAPIGGVGAPVGAAVGATVGGITGGIIGYQCSKKMVRENYISWKRQHRKDEFMSEFNKFHEDHPELQDFICHITNNIYVDPIITKWGHTFSRSGITEWMKDHTTDPLPHDNGEIKQMTINDIEVDYYMIGKMKRAYVKILGDAEQLYGLSPETVTGLRAISRDLHIEFKEAFNTAKDNADDLLQRGIINPKQFAKILTDTADKMGD